MDNKWKLYKIFIKSFSEISSGTVYKDFTLNFIERNKIRLRTCLMVFVKFHTNISSLLVYCLKSHNLLQIR